LEMETSGSFMRFNHQNRLFHLNLLGLDWKWWVPNSHEPQRLGQYVQTKPSKHASTTKKQAGLKTALKRR
jgi:hypothetical protein